MITVKEVKSKADRKLFVKFPHQLFKNNKYWVPPIWSDELAIFDPSENPVFNHAEANLYLAYKDETIVGRVAAMVNFKEINEQGVSKLRFGWLDMIDDLEVTKALLEKVEQLAAKMGLSHVEGPVGFSNLDKAGMLVEGFEQIATIVTYYNHPYYPEHLEKLGYEKAAEWVEYQIDAPKEVPEKVERLAKVVQERYGVHTETLQGTKELKGVVDEVFDLFNQSYEKLHGFVPIEAKMKKYYAKKFLNLVTPEFVSIVRNEAGQLIAFGITMPSYARALQKAGGKLFPFGFYHILKAKRNPKHAELSLIGVRPDMQGKGIPTLIFKEIIEKFRAMNIETVETNPEYEDNKQVQALWKLYNAKQHKRRRSYKKAVQSVFK